MLPVEHAADCWQISVVRSDKTIVLRFGNMDSDNENVPERLVACCSDFEGDFDQTIALLEMEVDELHIEVENSLEEVLHVNSFYFI